MIQLIYYCSWFYLFTFKVQPHCQTWTKWSNVESFLRKWCVKYCSLIFYTRKCPCKSRRLRVNYTLPYKPQNPLAWPRLDWSLGLKQVSSSWSKTVLGSTGLIENVWWTKHEKLYKIISNLTIALNTYRKFENIPQKDLTS